jgi:6,7-dimethyl-8-ribityllumazine synthase
VSTSETGPALSAHGYRFAILASRFNELYVLRLVTAAAEVLITHGAGPDSIETTWVPGALELPLACRWAAESGRFDAVLAFGVVLRGETDHFRLVADVSAHGLARVALDTGVPVLDGILAAFDVDQVADRTGGHHGNRGADVALAAIRMAILRRTMAAR